MQKIPELAQRLLPRGSFARNASMLAGGTALSQALAVLAAPILTRLYPVADFGYFQVYLSLMAFGALAVTLRYEQAIYLPEREEVAAAVFAASFCTVAGMSLAFAALVWLVGRHQLLPRSVEGLSPYLWVIPLSVCGAGTYQTLSIWDLRQKGYRQVSATKVVQVGSQLSTQVGVGLVHAGPLGLLLGDALGRVAGSFSLARFAWQRNRQVFCRLRPAIVLRSALRYRRFPLISAGAALLGVAATALPPLLLAQFYGAKTLAWFALGDRVLGAPTLLVGQAVSQVYSVEAGALSSADPAAMQGLFSRSIKRLVLLGLLPYLMFAMASPALFSFIFGPAWREAGVYAQLLAMMHYLAFIVWPLTPTLNILEEQVWQLAWDAGRLGLTLGALWLAYRRGWPARGAIAAFGAAMLLGYAAHLLLSRYAIARRVRQSSPRPAARPMVAPEYAELEKL